MRFRGRLAALASVSLFSFVALSACSTTANVVDLYTGLDSPDDKGETRRRDVFFTDTKEIHCIAKVGLGRTDATFEWFVRQTAEYNFDTNEFEPRDRFVSYLEMTVDPNDGPIFLDFVLTATDEEGNSSEEAPFPAGSYVCEIALDGVIMQRKAFDIDFPPCPAMMIPPGGICFGFHTEGAQCPKDGERAFMSSMCTCSKEDGWVC